MREALEGRLPRPVASSIAIGGAGCNTSRHAKMEVAMLQQIIDAIDAEIAKRNSGKIGIKFSLDLFNVLARAGVIKAADFSAWGTGAFPQQLPAYKDKYFASVDFDFNGLEFEVGVPKP